MVLPAFARLFSVAPVIAEEKKNDTISAPLPGYENRFGDKKKKLIRSGGGNDETEAAVALALAWISRQQNAEGYWEYDGSHKEDRIAATGMALLPFLAAGESHKTGDKYKKNVSKGLDYLTSKIKPNGQFGDAGMYSHAIATIAICEAFGMTQDEKLKQVAKKAIEFIVKAQSNNGSWGYTAGNIDGDTSIVGWQIQALKSAKLAGISVPDKTLGLADAFLISVSEDNESRYGYRTKGSTSTLSASGLLSRMLIKNQRRSPWIARGIVNLWKERKPDEKIWDMYYYYYSTEVVHHFDLKHWHQDWNPAIRKILLDKQLRAPKAKESDGGAWPKDTTFIGNSCGKLGTSCLACLTLEVYYRNRELGRIDPEGALKFLEGKE